MRGKGLLATFYFLASIFLAGLIPILPAVLLYMSRRLFGRYSFIMLASVATLGLCWICNIETSASQNFGIFGILDPALLAVNFLGISLLVGAFAELEEHGALVSSVATSVAIGSLGTVGAVSLLSYFRGPGWYTKIHTNLQTYIDGTGLITAQNLAVNSEDLLLQSPSIMLVFYIASLLLVLALRKQMFRWVEIKSPSGVKLSNFRLPDMAIWFFIVALLMAFTSAEQSWVNVVGYNVLNVTLLLYFLQGLGVITKFFEVQKIGTGWRVLWMTIFVLQLFLVVSFLGVVDYWTDFRARLVKKVTL